MQKDIEMQLKTIITIFKTHAHLEYIEEYIKGLESGTLNFHETKFAINKLIDYCKQNSWDDEKKELIDIINKIENNFKQNELSEKHQEPINKFWVSFYEWMYTELPSSKWLYDSYIEYDGWNGERIYLNLNFDNLFRKYLGIPYDGQYDNQNICKIEDIKTLIELMYSELILIKERYNFTIHINKVFSKFSLPYELKSGKLIKKGYKSTENNLPIINFQMLESKIIWSEDKILGTETLDKHTALNYITDSLQYLLSLVNTIDTNEASNKNIKQKCAILSDNNIDGKVYSVILNEVSAIQTIVNEYFDIRHNEYLSSKSKTIREPLKDKQFIEYLYNRISSLLYFLKSKYVLYQKSISNK